MLISLKWLAEYVDLPATGQLADALTALGLEVAEVRPINQGLEGVVAGRILDIKPHPKADRLTVCVVDDGSGSPKDVVCGAPNVTKDLVSALAPVGATLPGGMKIKQSKIRGVTSFGMLCAEDELGISADHSAILELPADMAPGSSLGETIADQVIELDLTPNRPDCLCMLGVAREVAARFGGKLRYPETDPPETGDDINAITSIQVPADQACPRYAARFVDRIGIYPSPLWMRMRLIASGVRPISNVVDVTNYVLLEMGQPLHAFDFDRLAGGRVVVKHAQEGERFFTLDGVERILSPADLMICDGEQAVGLAGIMGGLNSEIVETTHQVLIESAFFEPMGIRRSAKRLEMSTEASFRFERGIDVENCARAVDRAARLMAELAGGRVARGLIDVYPKAHVRPTLTMSVARTNRYLGLELDAPEMTRQLQSIELGVETRDEDTLLVTPPGFRVDLEREVDLTEEIARLTGFDAVPETLPEDRVAAAPRRHDHLVRARARQVMSGLGYAEVITYSFGAPSDADALRLPDDHPGQNMVRLLNPLSEDQSVLRTGLLPGMLRALQRNLAFRVADVRLFEWGQVFQAAADGNLPDEKLRLAGLRAGLGDGDDWHHGDRRVNFFDVRGDLETLWEGLMLPGFSLERPESGAPQPFLDEAEAAAIVTDGRTVGWIGRIEDSVLKNFDIDLTRAYGFGLHLEDLVDLALVTPVFSPLARYPDVVRDVALVVAKEVTAADLLGLVEKDRIDILESVSIFDVYEGAPIEPGHGSIGLRFRYQSLQKTLTEDEVNQVHDRLVAEICQGTGAKVRAG
jgi:phenylalanyl-tRNA synthetase beta chain